MLSVYQRIHQSKVKWRIIAHRERRAFNEGKLTIIGDYEAKRERDLVEQAFKAGVRHAKGHAK